MPNIRNTFQEVEFLTPNYLRGYTELDPILRHIIQTLYNEGMLLLGSDEYIKSIEVFSDLGSDGVSRLEQPLAKGWYMELPCIRVSIESNFEIESNIEHESGIVLTGRSEWYMIDCREYNAQNCCNLIRIRSMSPNPDKQQAIWLYIYDDMGVEIRHNPQSLVPFSDEELKNLLFGGE